MSSTYVITGGSRGIGLEFARQLSARGDTVIATARDPDRAADLSRAAARVVPLDVTDPASIELLPSYLDGVSIDVLINNAGVSSEQKTISQCGAAELQRVFMVNSTAPVLVARALLDRLRAGRRRQIVNITSQLGSITNNTGGSSYPYRASKAALNMLTRSMANELANEGFVCVAVHPGWVRTDMGGPSAPLAPSKAVAAMLRLFDRLDAGQNGHFLNFDGASIPW